MFHNTPFHLQAPSMCWCKPYNLQAIECYYLLPKCCATLAIFYHMVLSHYEKCMTQVKFLFYNKVLPFFDQIIITMLVRSNMVVLSWSELILTMSSKMAKWLTMSGGVNSSPYMVECGYKRNFPISFGIFTPFHCKRKVSMLLKFHLIIWCKFYGIIILYCYNINCKGYELASHIDRYHFLPKKPSQG